jgi:hypothetical protein
MLAQFTIDEQYLCNVVIREQEDTIKDRTNLTNSDIIKIIKGEDYVLKRTYTRDHPQFSLLRNQLDQQGYIKIERSCINGDTVLKPFKLNEWEFCTGDRFLSATAMMISISVARKRGLSSTKLR